MTPTRVVWSLACLAVMLVHTAPCGAQADPDRRVSGGGALPPGWNGQTDWSPRTRSAPSLADIAFVATADGYRATMGPAAIFWRDADTASGAYRVAAAITQLENPRHPESYGLFVGGRDLAGEGQAYLYFLVRAHDGKFSIRQRTGRQARPRALVDWTAHAAVARADSSTGRATNTLAIESQGGSVRFLLNGIAVHEAAAVGTDGIVGYRVNHNLDVGLSPLDIHGLERR